MREKEELKIREQLEFEEKMKNEQKKKKQLLDKILENEIGKLKNDEKEENKNIFKDTFVLNMSNSPTIFKSDNDVINISTNSS